MAIDRKGPRRRRACRLGGAMLGVFALSSAAAAASEPSPAGLEIRYIGPPECGSEAELRAATERLLGVSREAEKLLATARVTAVRGGRYRLSLSLSGSVAGERTLEAETCSAALKAAAVVIALAIDPKTLQRAADQEAESEQESPAEVAQPSEPEAAAPSFVGLVEAAPTEPAVAYEDVPADPFTASEAPSGEPPRFRAFFGAGARLSSGLGPSTRGGARLAAGVDRGFLRAALDGYFEPDRDHELAPAGSVRHGAWGGGVRLCGEIPEPLSLELRLCAGLSLNRLRARAPDVLSSTPRHAYVYTSAFGAALAFPLTDALFLAGDVVLRLPTTAPRFVVELPGGGSENLFRVESGIVAGLGLEYRL